MTHQLLIPSGDWRYWTPHVDTEVSCPVCGAVVDIEDVPLHAKWHEDLNAKVDTKENRPS